MAEGVGGRGGGARRGGVGLTGVGVLEGEVGQRGKVGTENESGTGRKKRERRTYRGVLEEYVEQRVGGWDREG